MFIVHRMLFLALKKVRIVKITSPQALTTQYKYSPQGEEIYPPPLTAIWKALEEYITQHKPLVCSFKIRKIKNRRNFEPSRKIWKLHEDSVKGNFSSYVKKYGASSQKVASVEGYWNVLKEALPEATGRSFWTDKKSR